MMIRITAPLTPVPFTRVMANGKRRYNSARYTEFKDELGFFAFQAMGGREPFKGCVRVSAEFYKKRRGVSKGSWGDVDNFLKAVLDSLIGICYVDDGQVIQVSAAKAYGDPRIVIEVEEVR